MSTFRKDETKQVWQHSYFEQLRWKSLPRMWDLAEHLNWSVLLLIVVVPLAENRWCTRNQCHPLEDCIYFLVGLRGYIFLCGYRSNMNCEWYFCFKTRKIAPFPPKRIVSVAELSIAPTVFLDASPHQASGTWQTIRLKNRKEMGKILMHEQSNEECQSHASYSLLMTRTA